MFLLDTEELTKELKTEGLALWEYALNQETERSGRSREELREQMAQSLAVMERSASTARKEPVQSVSGLTGGNAYRYDQYRREGKSLLGNGAFLFGNQCFHAMYCGLPHGRILWDCTCRIVILCRKQRA